MSGDNDKPRQEDPSAGAIPDGMDLTSYLKDKAPTVSRILKEEEERTAALAAGNGGADEMELEFAEDGAENGAENGSEDDDPFVIVEEDSFDISFDTLEEDDGEDLTPAALEPDEAESLEEAESPEEDPFDIAAIPADEPDPFRLSEDDLDDDDLGPPLVDPSAPPEDLDLDTDLDMPEDDPETGATEDDLPDIEFIEDEDAPEEEPTAGTPAGAEPLELAKFDDGLDIAFDDEPESPAPKPEIPDAAAMGAPAGPPHDMSKHAGGEDMPDIEMSEDDEDMSAPSDEFAAWNEEGDEEDAYDEDLGPPLPDLSAPPPEDEPAAEEASVEAEPVPDMADDDAWPEDDALPDLETEGSPDAEPEAVEAEEELVLEIEGLEFEMSGDGEDAGAAEDGSAAPAAEAMPEIEAEAEPDVEVEDAPAPEPEEAAPPPIAAEPAKPVSVQEALMAAIELHRIGDLEGAARGYEGLVRRFPNSAAGWINLGIVLRRLNKLDAALVCLRRGVMLNPKDGAAWSNLGNALRAANFLEDAKRAQIKAISLTPGAAQIHYNMGLVIRDFGDLIEADACFRRAELLGYANPDLAWDQSLNLLLSGNLEEGFEAYEARWNLPETKQRYADLPRWGGDMQSDKTVVIHAEQGLGDTLQFCRYVPALKSRVGRLIFDVQPHLVDLLNATRRFGGIEVHARDQGLVEADMQMPLLSAPILLPLGESVLPGRDPYLTPPPDGPRIRDEVGGPRIGIAWAGKPTHKNDGNRSAGLGAFTALFDVLNARFYSLQIGPAQAQLHDLALGAVLQDLSPAIRSFADTASLLQDLDLVVTVDTSVAHLAGALGKPVWVLLPYAPDWRWQLKRQDSPWYPSMRLFRQAGPGDWDGVFMRVRAALDEFIDGKTGKDA